VHLGVELHAGPYSRGAHARHAWVLVPTVTSGADAPLVVDLLHEVGETYEEGSRDAQRYQRLGEFRFTSLQGSARAWTTTHVGRLRPASASRA